MLRQLLSYLGHEVSRARSYFLQLFFVYPQKRNIDFFTQIRSKHNFWVNEKMCQLSR